MESFVIFNDSIFDIVVTYGNSKVIIEKGGKHVFYKTENYNLLHIAVDDSQKKLFSGVRIIKSILLKNTKHYRIAFSDIFGCKVEVEDIQNEIVIKEKNYEINYFFVGSFLECSGPKNYEIFPANKLIFSLFVIFTFMFHLLLVVSSMAIALAFLLSLIDTFNKEDLIYLIIFSALTIILTIFFVSFLTRIKHCKNLTQFTRSKKNVRIISASPFLIEIE